eukprot:146132-Chlamydomonas_euryale.AAC.1
MCIRDSSWGADSPAPGAVPRDWFVSRYTFYLPVDLPGRYAFQLSADDNAQLFVDGEMVGQVAHGGAGEFDATLSSGVVKIVVRCGGCVSARAPGLAALGGWVVLGLAALGGWAVLGSGCARAGCAWGLGCARAGCARVLGLGLDAPGLGMLGLGAPHTTQDWGRTNKPWLRLRLELKHAAGCALS